MIEFIFAFLVILTVVTIMSIGVIRGRPPIAGSCGGLNSLGVKGGCEICGGDVSNCKQPNG